MPGHDPSRPRKQRRSRSKRLSIDVRDAEDEAAPTSTRSERIDESSIRMAEELPKWRLVGTVEDWAPVLMSSNYASHLALEDSSRTLLRPSSAAKWLSSLSLRRIELACTVRSSSSTTAGPRIGSVTA